MSNDDYKREIIELLKTCTNENMLDLVYKLLCKCA